jgi:hypothetical protein
LVEIHSLIVNNQVIGEKIFSLWLVNGPIHVPSYDERNSQIINQPHNDRSLGQLSRKLEDNEHSFCSDEDTTRYAICFAAILRVVCGNFYTLALGRLGHVSAATRRQDLDVGSVLKVDRRAVAAKSEAERCKTMVRLDWLQARVLRPNPLTDRRELQELPTTLSTIRSHRSNMHSAVQVMPLCRPR